MHKSPLFAMLLLAGCDDDGRSACENAVQAKLDQKSNERIAVIKPDNGESNVLFGYMFILESSENILKKRREIYCVYDKESGKIGLDYPKSPCA